MVPRIAVDSFCDVFRAFSVLDAVFHENRSFIRQVFTQSNSPKQISHKNIAEIVSIFNRIL
jgi:hypothetical protein